jgi:hypothetical protein
LAELLGIARSYAGADSHPSDVSRDACGVLSSICEARMAQRKPLTDNTSHLCD